VGQGGLELPTKWADASPRNRYLTDFDVLSRRPWDIPTVDSFFYESSQGRKMDMSE